MVETNSNVEHSPPSNSRVLLESEDYWAIWLGGLLLIAGLLIYLPNPPERFEASVNKYNRILAEESRKAPIKTIEWHLANQGKAQLKATDEPFSKSIKRWAGKPHTWHDNPLEAFVLPQASAEIHARSGQHRLESQKAKSQRSEAKARLLQSTAEAAEYKDPRKNSAAEKAISAFIAQHRLQTKTAKYANTTPYNQLGDLILFGIFIGLLFALAGQIMNGSGIAFLKGFGFVFALAITAYFIAAQTNVRAMGIGYAAWAIVLGLIISNTIGTPTWVKPAVQVEFFIKTGLVLLGAEILFGKILTIGMPGIFVAWVVTPIVLVATYWFGQNILKLESKTLNITLSADMSVCGVSAAIATASVCRAKKEELTLAVGISLVFTSLMMVILPNIVLAFDMDHILGGAWMGGTIDSTGAVAAAGAFLGDQALYVAATIKMIQNILIGVIAVAIAYYWATRIEKRENVDDISMMEIWHRFPKFILGFIGASIVFSLIYQSMGADMGTIIINHGVIDGWSKLFRGWFFCLAFVSIGLSTDFRKLGHYLKGGKPVILYVCGQALNLLLTLVMAYFMFFIVFPSVTASI